MKLRFFLKIKREKTKRIGKNIAEEKTKQEKLI